VKQLGRWIGCVLSGNREAHKANNALSNFGLLFCLTCQFFTTAADLQQVTIDFVLKIFSFSDRELVLGDAFDKTLLGCSMMKHTRQTGGPRAKCGPRSLNFKPQPT